MPRPDEIQVNAQAHLASLTSDVPRALFNLAFFDAFAQVYPNGLVAEALDAMKSLKQSHMGVLARRNQDSQPLLDGDAVEHAEDVEVQEKPRVKHKQLPSDTTDYTASEWRDVILAWAAEHSGVFDVSAYRSSPDCPKPRPGHRQMRLYTTLSVAVRKEKILRRDKAGVYSLTPKGQKQVVKLHAADTEAEKPPSKRGRPRGSLLERITNYAMSNGNVLNAKSFRLHELTQGRTAPGGAFYRVVNGPGFQKLGEGQFRLLGRARVLKK